MSNSSYLTEVNRVSGGFCRLSSHGRRIGQQLGQLTGGEGMGEQEALDALAVEQAQGDELVLGFDPLGGHRAAQRPGQADQRGDDRLITRVTSQPGHEAAIDLDRVQGVLLEPGERRVAGAEVVERVSLVTSDVSVTSRTS
jgi:hypothetical protein